MYGLDHVSSVRRVFTTYGYNNALTSQNNPNRMRKQNIAQRLRLYRNDADQDFANAIGLLFTDANVISQRIKLIPMASYENVTKRIVDEVASLYNRPAVRKMTDHDEEYRALCVEVRLDNAMKEAQRMLLLCNDVLMMCVKNAKGRHRLRVVTSDLFSAIPDADDPSELAAVLIDRFPEGSLAIPTTDDNQCCYELWDDTYRYLLSGSGMILNYQEHGLGRLPCVLMHGQEPDARGLLRADYGQDIISAHLAVFALNVMTLRLAKSQGERQPVFVGDAAQNASSQSADGERPICLTPGSQAFMLDSMTSPEHYLLAKRDIKSAVGQTYGLSYAQMSLTDDTSGKSLEQHREKLKELRDEQRQRGDIHEREICALLGFDPSELSVDFSEQTIAIDANEEISLLKERVKMGLDSCVAYLMRKNPDLSETESVLFLKKNIAYYATWVEMIRALNVPSEGGGNSPQANGANNDGTPTVSAPDGATSVSGNEAANS